MVDSGPQSLLGTRPENACANVPAQVVVAVPASPPHTTSPGDSVAFYALSSTHPGPLQPGILTSRSDVLAAALASNHPSDAPSAAQGQGYLADSADAAPLRDSTNLAAAQAAPPGGVARSSDSVPLREAAATNNSHAAGAGSPRKSTH